MTGEELRKKAAAIRWHHKMDLGQGVTTPGVKDCAAHMARHHFPQDLTGKTVLDVGAWDGFYSFEAERRGAARVVALDSFVWQDPRFTKAGFNLAHEVLGSKVEAVYCDVLDMNPADLGTFDLVLFLGVLYHMRHPLLALEKAAAMTHDMLMVETHIEPLEDDRLPVMRFFPGRELCGDATNWWGPNVEAVTCMLKDVGFRRVELKSLIAEGRRAVFHAWK